MNDLIPLNPVLLIAVPLGLAFLMPLLALISKKMIRWIPVIGFLFNSILSVLLLPRVLEETQVIQIGGFTPPFGINLVAGPVGILFSVLISVTGFLVAVYALNYIREGAEEKYHILYMLLLTGATGVVLTGDLFNLFVFFEVLCISSYALVAYRGNRAGIESSVKYLIQGSIGSSLLLVGIALVYGQLGTLNMADIARQIGTLNSKALAVPMILMVTGLGIEAAVFPLNAWLPDAHSSAPSSISAVLSGIAIEVGLYAVLRILFTLFGVSDFWLLLLFLGVLTLLIGEMCAFAQDNIKRMLAYSSIGQIGLILFAFSIATPAGVSGGLFQMVNHTLSKALLFLASGFMIVKTGSMKNASFEGLARKMPLTVLLFTVGTFSLIGLPPFAGFASKFMIIRAALAQQQQLYTILIGLVLLGTVIEGAYFFRVIQRMFFKNEDQNALRQESPAAGLIPMMVFSIIIIFIGLYPGLMTKILDPAASELINKMEYIRSVLG